MPNVTLEEAKEVHGRMLIVDGHTDTPVEHIARGENIDWENRDPAYHMDIPRCKEGGYDAGFFIVGNGVVADVRVTLQQTLESIERFPDDLVLVSRSADIVNAHETGRIGVMPAIEGAEKWLNGHLEVLRMYHRLGVRALGITHGEGGDEPTMLQGSRSPFGPCTAAERENERKNAKGLTDFGKAVLKESNRLRIVTDLAHINDKAFYELMDMTELPVTMTHTAAFSQCPHWRCLTDDQIRALAQNGGVMGVAFVPSFVDTENGTLERYVDHICYVADLVGIDHIAIGTDYDGMGSITPIVENVSLLPTVTQEMMSRGMSEEDMAKVWGGNFMRLFQQTIDTAA